MSSDTTTDELRAAMSAAKEAYDALPDRAPNPRDFEGPDQWAQYDAAHALWQAEGVALMARREQLHRQFQAARKAVA